MHKHNGTYPKYKPLLGLATALFMTGCATDRTPQPNLTSQGQIEPLACTEFAPIHFNPGKPGATVQDVISAMQAHPEDPLGWARGVLGDTKTTRDAVAANYAVRKALHCKNL